MMTLIINYITKSFEIIPSPPLIYAYLNSSASLVLRIFPIVYHDWDISKFLYIATDYTWWTCSEGIFLLLPCHNYPQLIIGVNSRPKFLPSYPYSTVYTRTVCTDPQTTATRLCTTMHINLTCTNQWFLRDLRLALSFSIWCLTLSGQTLLNCGLNTW